MVPDQNLIELNAMPIQQPPAQRIHTNGEVCSQYGTPHMYITLNKQCEVLALVDTGAVFSLSDCRLIPTIPNVQVYPTIEKPITANEEPIVLLGATWLTVTMADVEEVILFHIQEAGANCAVLGTNFLNRFERTSFDYSLQCVQFKQQWKPCFGMIANPPVQCGTILMDHNVIIPPQSMTYFHVPVINSIYNDQEVIFTPELLKTNEPIFLAHSVATVIDQQMLIQAMNPYTVPSIIYHGCMLGTISFLPKYNAGITVHFNDQQPKPTSHFNYKSYVLSNNQPLVNRKWIETNAQISDQVSSPQHNDLINILMQYPNFYASGDQDCGKTTLVEYTITTGQARPFKQVPYQKAPAEKEIINQQVDIPLQHGIVRPSSSPWFSNVILVKRKIKDTVYVLIFTDSIPLAKRMSILFHGLMISSTLFEICDTSLL